jgi:hypothetical protein
LVVNGNKRTTELSRVEAEYIYNLTGGALRLLGSPCHPILKPVRPFFLYYLSRNLVVFPKMSQWALWRMDRFTFALVLLYRDSDRPLTIRCLATFQIVDFRIGGLYNRGRIVYDASVWCKMYIMEVWCATCISWNRGHKKSIASSRDEL